MPSSEPVVTNVKVRKEARIALQDELARSEYSPAPPDLDIADETDTEES